MSSSGEALEAERVQLLESIPSEGPLRAFASELIDIGEIVKEKNNARLNFAKNKQEKLTKDRNFKMEKWTVEWGNFVLKVKKLARHGPDEGQHGMMSSLSTENKETETLSLAETFSQLIFQKREIIQTTSAEIFLEKELHQSKYGTAFQDVADLFERKKGELMALDEKKKVPFQILNWPSWTRSSNDQEEKKREGKEEEVKTKSQKVKKCVQLEGDIVDRFGHSIFSDVCSVCSERIQYGWQFGVGEERYRCLECDSIETCGDCFHQLEDLVHYCCLSEYEENGHDCFALQNQERTGGRTLTRKVDQDEIFMMTSFQELRKTIHKLCPHLFHFSVPAFDIVSSARMDMTPSGGGSTLCDKLDHCFMKTFRDRPLFGLILPTEGELVYDQHEDQQHFHQQQQYRNILGRRKNFSYLLPNHGGDDATAMSSSSSWNENKKVGEKGGEVVDRRKQKEVVLFYTFMEVWRHILSLLSHLTFVCQVWGEHDDDQGQPLLLSSNSSEQQSVELENKNAHQEKSDKQPQDGENSKSVPSPSSLSIGILHEDSYLYYISELATVRLKACAVGLEPKWSISELRAAIEVSQCSVVLTSSKIWKRVQERGLLLSACSNLKQVICVDHEGFSHVKEEDSKKNLQTEEKNCIHQGVSVSHLVLPLLPEMQKKQEGKQDVDQMNNILQKINTSIPSTQRQKQDSDIPTIVVFSSGTTGGVEGSTPKGVQFSALRWWKDIDSAELSLPSVDISMFSPAWATDKLLVWKALFNGTAVGVVPYEHRRNALDYFRIFRPTGSVSLVPLIGQQLVDLYEAKLVEIQRMEEEEEGDSLSLKNNTKRSRSFMSYSLATMYVFEQVLGGRVATITLGGARVSPELIQKLQMYLPCQIVETYGATEFMGGGQSSPKHQGGINLFSGKNVKLLDLPELGYSHADIPNPRGEICMKGDSCVAMKDWVATSEAKQKIAARYLSDGYLRTGDIAELLPNGSYKIIGRLSGHVKMANGEFFSPDGIEAALSYCSSEIGEVVVTVVVHEDVGGEHLVAIVEKRKGKNDEGERISSSIASSEGSLSLVNLLRRRCEEKFLPRSLWPHFAIWFPQAMDSEEEEGKMATTGGMKLRRNLVIAKCQDLLKDVVKTCDQAGGENAKGPNDLPSSPGDIMLEKIFSAIGQEEQWASFLLAGDEGGAKGKIIKSSGKPMTTFQALGCDSLMCTKLLHQMQRWVGAEAIPEIPHASHLASWDPRDVAVLLLQIKSKTIPLSSEQSTMMQGKKEEVVSQLQKKPIIATSVTKEETVQYEEEDDKTGIRKNHSSDAPNSSTPQFIGDQIFHELMNASVGEGKTNNNDDKKNLNINLQTKETLMSNAQLKEFLQRYENTLQRKIVEEILPGCCETPSNREFSPEKKVNSAIPSSSEAIEEKATKSSTHRGEQRNDDNNVVFLVTGGNGFLGRFVIWDLILSGRKPPFEKKRTLNDVDEKQFLASSAAIIKVHAIIRASSDKRAKEKLFTTLLESFKATQQQKQEKGQKEKEGETPHNGREQVSPDLLYPFLEESISVHAGDVAHPYFGLSPEKYQFLQQETNLVIHCAAMVKDWSVRTGLLQQLPVNVESCFHLAKFVSMTSSTSPSSCQGTTVPEGGEANTWKKSNNSNRKRCIPCLHISTESCTHSDLSEADNSIQNLSDQYHLIQEGEEGAAFSAYAASKYIGEVVLRRVCTQAKIPLRIVRCGMLTFPTLSSAMWVVNKEDWVMRFLYSLKRLHCTSGLAMRATSRHSMPCSRPVAKNEKHTDDVQEEKGAEKIERKKDDEFVLHLPRLSSSHRFNRPVPFEPVDTAAQQLTKIALDLLRNSDKGNSLGTGHTSEKNEPKGTETFLSSSSSILRIPTRSDQTFCVSQLLQSIFDSFDQKEQRQEKEEFGINQIGSTISGNKIEGKKKEGDRNGSLLSSILSSSSSTIRPRWMPFYAFVSGCRNASAPPVPMYPLLHLLPVDIEGEIRAAQFRTINLNLEGDQRQEKEEGEKQCDIKRERFFVAVEKEDSKAKFFSGCFSCSEKKSMIHRLKQSLLHWVDEELFTEK